MDEKKKPEQPKPEKALSRTTLTFYIVGLFSVAIALILISYVAQARADKQLDSLSDQLTEQQTVAQGATQKMEDLQKQFDAINSALDEVRTSLDCELAETDVVSAVKQRMEEREVYALSHKSTHSFWRITKQKQSRPISSWWISTEKTDCLATPRIALIPISISCLKRCKSIFGQQARKQMSKPKDLK